MSEKQGFSYQWNSPSDWLLGKYPNHHRVLAIYNCLDNDTIQNSAESEMSDDGYFDPIAGVYRIDFTPEDEETLAALNDARWEAEPLYGELIALGCHFLGLTIRPSGVCSFTMACPCPMDKISELDGVDEVEEAEDHVISACMKDPQKRQLIESVL